MITATSAPPSFYGQPGNMACGCPVTAHPAAYAAVMACITRRGEPE